MDTHFPSPPNLDRSTAQALVKWLDAMAVWLSADTRLLALMATRSPVRA